MIAGISRLSWKMVAFWLALASGPILISYWTGGWTSARPELQILVYSIITVVSVFSAILLFQLWCAPFKILKDRGDTIGMKIDPEKWKDITAYTLEEAACLWVDAPIHSPIENPDALSAFFKLRDAMLARHLSYRSGVITSINRALGEAKAPDGSQVLTAIDLRKYADRVGAAPTFLQCVEIPLESAQEKGADSDVAGKAGSGRDRQVT